MPTWLLIALGGGITWLLLRSSRGIPVAVSEGALPTTPGLHEGVLLAINGITREVCVYIPPVPQVNAPLFLVCHETGGSARAAIEESGVRALGFVAIGLQARAQAGGDWDGHQPGVTYYDTYPNVSPATNNDLQLAQYVITAARQQYGVSKVYTMGFSNGAFFAYFAAAVLGLNGFAAASGGLVHCRTTASCDYASGNPTCNEAAARCACADVEKPIAVPASPRLAGYLAHAGDDYVVSMAYSCRLAARMQAVGHPVKLALRAAGGHNWPPNFVQDAWAFLSQY